jgi:hypothetical protein
MPTLIFPILLSRADGTDIQHPIFFLSLSYTQIEYEPKHEAGQLAVKIFHTAYAMKMDINQIEADLIDLVAEIESTPEGKQVFVEPPADWDVPFLKEMHLAIIKDLSYGEQTKTILRTCRSPSFFHASFCVCCISLDLSLRIPRVSFPAGKIPTHGLGQFFHYARFIFEINTPGRQQQLFSFPFGILQHFVFVFHPTITFHIIQLFCIRHFSSFMSVPKRRRC